MQPGQDLGTPLLGFPRGMIIRQVTLPSCVGCLSVYTTRRAVYSWSRVVVSAFFPLLRGPYSPHLPHARAWLGIDERRVSALLLAGVVAGDRGAAPFPPYFC